MPIQSKKPAAGPCEVEGCHRPRTVQGLCGPHYNRKRRHGDPLAGGAYRTDHAGGPCGVEECDREARSRGYCLLHYARYARHGDPRKGARKTAEGTVHKSGYRYFKIPDHPMASRHGKVAEHRLIMAERLGRPLLPTEDVHHVNGNRLDNRVGNLELWTRNQPHGQRVRDLLAWAREIEALYGTDYDTGIL